MDAPSDAARDEVAQAVADEVGRLGPAGLDKAAIVNKFLATGVSRATLYRWVDRALAGGMPGQSLIRQVRQAAKERKAAVAAGPAADSAAAVGARLPMSVTPDDVSPGQAVRVIELLADIVTDLKSLIGHSKTPEGKVRNARLLLAANGEMRKTLETAMRLYEAMREVQQVDKLHAAIIARIAAVSPETADLILKDIDAIAAQWTGA